MQLMTVILLAFIVHATPSFSTSGVPCYLRPSGDKCHYSQKPDSPACTSGKTRLRLENGARQLNRSMYSLEQQLIRLGVIPPDNACSELPSVHNGGVVYSALTLAPGTVGKYICDEGYELRAFHGRREFTCNEYGVWDGNVTTVPVTCVLMVETCDPPEDIINGSILYLDDNRESVLPGDMITYTCDEGYELAGNKSRFCLRTGNWSGRKPECIWRTTQSESQGIDVHSMVAGVSVSSVLLVLALVATVTLVVVVVVIKCGQSRKGRTNSNEQLIVSHEEQSPSHSVKTTEYTHVEGPVKSKKKSTFRKPGNTSKVYNKGFEDSTF